MERPDQLKRTMTTEERLERAVDQIQRIADPLRIWDGMPADEERELIELLFDSLAEIVRETALKYEHPTSGFKV